MHSKLLTEKYELEASIIRYKERLRQYQQEHIHKQWKQLQYTPATTFFEPYPPKRICIDCGHEEATWDLDHPNITPGIQEYNNDGSMSTGVSREEFFKEQKRFNIELSIRELTPLPNAIT